MKFKIYPPSKIDILTDIINDIENNKINEFLLWSPIEHYFPGDGHFNDEGKSFNRLVSLVNEKNINFFALFGAPSEQEFYNKDRENNIKILGWPTSLLHYTDRYTNGVEVNNKFEKLFVCLNNRSHTHRSQLIDSLYKNNLFDYGKISWKQEDRILNNHQFKFWDETKLILDDDKQEFYYDSKCFLNLVSESISERLFFSEKTFKPILTEQTFFCFGFPNQNIYLKNYGFELYDEIFNYNFDVSANIEKRIEGVIQNLNNIKNYKLEDLYDSVKEKIQFNKENALFILEKDPYISEDIRLLFEKHKNVFLEFYKRTNCRSMGELIKILN
jgi:hypothetical protein